jgi:hypothetical protein
MVADDVHLLFFTLNKVKFHFHIHFAIPTPVWLRIVIIDFVIIITFHYVLQVVVLIAISQLYWSSTYQLKEL